MLGSRALLAIPILHVIACYIYLYFFSLGFGGNVIQLTDVGDVFSVSIGYLLPFYIYFLSSVVAVQLWLFDKPLEIEALKDPKIHDTLDRPWFTWFQWFLISCLIMNFVIMIVFQNTTMHVIFAFMIMIVPFFLIKEFVKRNGIRKSYGIFSIFIIFGIFVMIAQSYRDGFQARHAPYQQLQDRPFACDGKGKFLFSAGDYLIISQANGRRSVYSQDCKKIMDLSRRTVQIDII